MILNYIDPGSGSLILQLLIASFVAIVTFSKRVKMVFTAYFRKLFKKG